MKLKLVLYYVSFLILITGFIQLTISLIDGNKILMLKRQGVTEKGVIIDKFIQERFQGPETGYRLHFLKDSLNIYYGNHFFKSYNDKYNRGDTLCVIHCPADRSLTRLCGFRDAFSDTINNLLMAVALLIAGWIGIKKSEIIAGYIKGQ